MTQKISGFLEKAVEYAFLGCAILLPFSKAALEICVVSGIICWTVLKLLRREGLTASGKLGLLVTVFILTSSVSAFYSGWPRASVQGVLRLLKYTFFMLAAADFFCPKDRLKKLMAVMFVGFFLTLLDSFYQLAAGKDLIAGMPTHLAGDQIRLTAAFKSYGLLAAYLIALTPLAAALALKKWSWYAKAFGGLFSVTAIYVLYKTYSRGAWIAGAISWLLFAFLVRNRWMGIALLAVLFAAPFVIPRQALIHLDFFSREQSLVERQQLWSRALSVISAKPLFGCGINTFVQNYPKYVNTKDGHSFQRSERAQFYANFPPEERWRVPGDPSHIPHHAVHNGYLQLAAESGLVSLVLFLGLLLAGLKSGFGAFRRSVGETKIFIAGLFCGFAALLLQAGIDTTLHNLQSATLIWLFLGLLLAVGKEFRPSAESR